MTHKLTSYLKLSLVTIIFAVFLSTNVQGQSVNNTITTDENFNLQFDSILNLENNPIQPHKPNIFFPDTADGRIFQKIINQTLAQNLDSENFSNILQSVAIALLGSQYQAGLLDNHAQETLVISLQKFDCLLFVENVIAIARNIANQDYNYDSFTKRVAQQRYVQGKMIDYCTRLHYFSHWIADNEKRGLVDNITNDLGGISVAKKLNFMTNHRNNYDQLIKNDHNYQCIAEVEKNLDELVFNYIPTNKIKNIYNKLKPGDIVGIATNIQGLDFTHTGLVYQNSVKNIGLIHASPVGQVVIAKDLHYYVKNVKNAIGIVVARPHIGTSTDFDSFKF